MARTSQGRLGVALGLLVALAIAAVGAFALTASDDATSVDARVVEPAPTTTSSTTTTIVVEHVTLPAGTAEVATARGDDHEIQVRRTPPAGWDHRLTPVVVAADPLPARSAQDRDRVTLPSAQQQIVGRHLTDGGWVFANPGAYQPPQPLVFGVVERQGEWVEVQLPVRPNGTTGWVSTEQVTLSATTRSVQISLTERRLRVVDTGAVLLDVPAGIGRPATPTPTGAFTVTDIVPSTDPQGGYGPVALALDGYSEVLDDFTSENAGSSPDANAPVLAIHGTNRPASVGAAQSNGCPRLYNTDVEQLVELVPAGTPVRIWP